MTPTSKPSRGGVVIKRKPKQIAKNKAVVPVVTITWRDLLAATREDKSVETQDTKARA